MFATVSYLHTGLIFVGKDKYIILKWSTTQVGSSLAFKYKTRMELSGTDKHVSLLRLDINACNMFITLHNLRMGPIHYSRMERLARDKTLKLFGIILGLQRK